MSALPVSLEVVSKRQLAAYAKRRPEWTRSDSVRWLNERSALVLAVLRRMDPAGAPKHSHAMGRWLQGSRPDMFARAHEKLLAVPASIGREKISVLGVLP